MLSLPRAFVRMLLGTAALPLLFGAAKAAAGRTENPIVAIMAHPVYNPRGPGRPPLTPDCAGDPSPCDFIAASYPKWIEAAGGRAVPVPYNASEAVLDGIFAAVNGLLLPGGGAPLGPSARYLVEKAIAANQGDSQSPPDYFPVWGTCLGFEWLLEIVSQEGAKVLDSGFDSENLTLSLNFTTAATDSRLFRGVGPAVTEIVRTEPVTMNNHGKGMTPAHLRAVPRLDAFFQILATNLDRKGREFVSVIEAREETMPVWGTQFHPEKSQFEFGEYPNGMPFEQISHTKDAVLAAQAFAAFFVEETRKNGHAFPTPATEQPALMYNYAPTPCTANPCMFVQRFFFKNFSNTRTETTGAYSLVYV